MNNPFDYSPDSECAQAFGKLLSRLESLKKSDKPEEINLCKELDAGKMLGVLIAADSDGNHHTLYAFSGQLGDYGFHYPGFVGPVFDYLQADGYFKKRETEIVELNIEISRFEKEILAEIRGVYEQVKEQLDAETAVYKEKFRLSKLERDARRASGNIGEDEAAAMIRQSQFEKAELRRLKKRHADCIEPCAAKLKEARNHLEELKAKRHADSEALQDWLFGNFSLLNARGESRSLKDIFTDTPLRIPPSGAGECCAPKLLQAAYAEGWQPVAMAEYWYGRAKGGEVRIHGRDYPACRGKCMPVLSWMLQGLSIHPSLESGGYAVRTPEPKIIFENEWFCVVEKPSGMLSVPGKGAAISVQQWLSQKYGPGKDVRMAHRLDQDTSGLLIAAFGQQSLKRMQALFATREVKKTYVADLEGDYRSCGIPQRGRIELPLSPDWLDRPRQRVDLKGGKEAVTDYEFSGVSDGRSRIIFHPQTGRTHQLRVHAASASGLALPIVGDRLYGHSDLNSKSVFSVHSKYPSHPRGNASLRLHLHAHRLEFTFPADGRSYLFESPVPF